MLARAFLQYWFVWNNRCGVKIMSPLYKVSIDTFLPLKVLLCCEKPYDLLFFTFFGCAVDFIWHVQKGNIVAVYNATLCDFLFSFEELRDRHERQQQRQYLDTPFHLLTSYCMVAVVCNHAILTKQSKLQILGSYVVGIELTKWTEEAFPLSWLPQGTSPMRPWSMS